ncbi:hypothetical protein F0460_15375 [Paenimyroides baculatum]|uniref:Uncharacterized protein n=1 Tax=Paenimyroides baculatum TaxID=2608000 RepID=A0A5M6C9M1_9FLAO|nr:hypothetical protein F0460_15375 [Paenimyroides baculatum]
MLFYNTVLLLFCGTNDIFAQTTGNRNITLSLSEVALLDIEPNINTIAFNFTTPTEAGMPISKPSVNTTKWINYTSAKATTSPHRIITSQIDQLFPGISIRLQAANSVGGGGSLGTSTGQITLSTSPQTIINAIGGAYTGNGSNNGHQLTISTDITNYTDLVKTTNQLITITYTISD